jgi:hypothetical protein
MEAGLLVMLTLSHGANGEPTNIQLKADAYMNRVTPLASMICDFCDTPGCLNFCLNA